MPDDRDAYTAALLTRALRAEAEVDRLKAMLPPPEQYIPVGPGGILLPPKIGHLAERRICMTYAGATVALWQSRAAQAWSGGVYGSGTLYSTLYTTEYNNARDTVGTRNGRGTPGWSSGQFWSTSASQWEQNALAWTNQANAWYNSRYTEGYNAGYPAGDAAAQNAYRPPGIVFEGGRFPHSNEGFPAGNLNPLPIVRENGGAVNAGYVQYNGNWTWTVLRAGHYAGYAHVDVHATWGGGVINVHLGGATYGRNFTGATDKTAGTGTPPVLLGAGSIIKFSGAVYAWNNPRDWGFYFIPEYSYPK